MEISNMKNMIVLKNLPSNLVEEAIVILKSNKNAKKLEYIESNTKKGYEKSVNQQDYIVREAESVISSYITNLEKNKSNKCSNNNIEKKYKKIKTYSIIVTTILVFCIIKTIFV